MLIDFLTDLRSKGVLNDYSDDHFIIRALNNDVDFFLRYSVFLEEHNPLLNNGVGYESIPANFLINLSAKLAQFSKLFGSDVLVEFVSNQMAAGKGNYDEDQFIRALSELHVLNYIGSYTGKIKNLTYEPKLIQGSKTNPEAVIELDDGLQIAIEVKTPGFKSPNNLNTTEGLFFRPNVVLKTESIKTLKELVEEEGVKFVYPNVLKLKDFIKSAHSKFDALAKNRINLLFINWTYNDFKTSGLNEPVSLLLNTYSGLLNSKLARNIIGLNDIELNNISSIIFYKDSFHSIISNDFRYHFAYNSIYSIPVNITKEQTVNLTKLTNIPLFNSDLIYHIDRSIGVKNNLLLDVKLYSELRKLLETDFPRA